ncbi:hypothetical protein [Effusibacillus pohliae]|uniref:hypothetical protein n=1 Tax=Effusibacillus pohliae TaxID=232270 RepID=UPI00037AFB3B|nr:hypothetical protein [Effusibacillus pohliae]
MSKCRACGTKIRWIQTKNGRYMPVNLENVSVEVGTLEPDTCIVTEGGSVLWGRHYRGGEINGYIVTGRISHFATCPAAGRFRRSG